MKKTTTGLLALILVGFCLLIPSNLDTVGSLSTFKISGFVLDSNGHGLASVEVAFIPGGPPRFLDYSNNSGYYEVETYSGYNLVTVSPPSDSNYVGSQQSLNVQSTMTLNFTLSLGYRLSGYVLDQNGNPIRSWGNGGVGIFLDNYWNGGWANSNGYYYVVAPPGTYIMHARKVEQWSYSGPGWSTEYELLNNSVFNLKGSITGNITVNFPNLTSSPTPSPTNTSTPTNTLTSTNGATSTPYSSQNLTPTPTVPEFPIWTILVSLGAMVVAASFVAYSKKRKAAKNNLQFAFQL